MQRNLVLNSKEPKTSLTKWIVLSVVLHAALVINQTQSNLFKKTSLALGPTVLRTKLVLRSPEKKIEKKEVIKKKIVKKARKKIAKKPVIKKEVQKKIVKQPINSVITKQKLVNNLIRNFSQPVYPRAALRRNMTGTVILGITLAKDGSVKSVKVNKSSGHSILDNSALNSVSDWDFNQLPNNYGEEITILKPINFKLQ